MAENKRNPKQSLKKKLGERKPLKEEGNKQLLTLSVQFSITLAEPLGELVFTNANVIKKGNLKVTNLWGQLIASLMGWGLPKITVEKISLIEAVDATY